MKLTLSTIGSRYASVAALNANFSAIATAMENTLSRDGTSPNALSANLDMNSNRILNLPAPTSNNEPVTRAYLETLDSNAYDASVSAAASAEAAAASATAAANSAANFDVDNLLNKNNNLSDLTNAATARTNLGGTTVGKAIFIASDAAAVRSLLSLVVGTDVQAYDANYAKTNAVQSFSVAQRGTPTSLTSSSASIAVNLALSNNFSHALTENTTLANPTNIVAGQCGTIVFTQNASAAKTLAFGSYWKFPGGTAPTLTTTLSAVDTLAYYVESSTRITCRMLGDVK
jgi:hypothetical protein